MAVGTEDHEFTAVVQLDRLDAFEPSALQARVAALSNQASAFVFELPSPLNHAVRAAVEAALGSRKQVTIRQAPESRVRSWPLAHGASIPTNLQVLSGDLMGVGHF